MFVASPAGEHNAIATIPRDLQQGIGFEFYFPFLFYLVYLGFIIMDVWPTTITYEVLGVHSQQKWPCSPLPSPVQDGNLLAFVAACPPSGMN